MRRTVLLLMMTTTALLMATGVALAVTKSCTPGSVCKGTTSNDTINGTNRVDTIKALAGADRITALGADDKIDGGSGSDTYRYIGSGWGKDTVADASGVDTIDFSGITGNNSLILTVSLASSVGDEAKSKLNGSLNGTVNWPDSVIENINGSPAYDTLIGSAASNRLFGNGDGDKLWGEDGDDFLSGGDDRDSLYGGDGNDTLEGGAGDSDALSGGAGNDTLRDISSGFWGTQLQGGPGDDTLVAGPDMDQLSGDEGNDTLYGEGGSDYYHFDSAPWGTDEIPLENGALGENALVFGWSISNLTIDLAEGTATDGTSVVTFPGSYIADVGASGQSDTITGNQQNNEIRSGNGDDVIDVAGGGSDFVYCGEGYDRVRYDSSDTTAYYSSYSFQDICEEEVLVP